MTKDDLRSSVSPVPTSPADDDDDDDDGLTKVKDDNLPVEEVSGPS